VAEERGDLEYAEEAYWRATSLAGDPARRADDLMAHARVLLARGNLAAAVAELEEALVLDPAHTGVLALLADQTFQAAHWERARGLYALLERSVVGDDVLPRALLLSRRAYLAHRAGDRDEAQACYAELARLDPRHLEARQGLAQLALERQDLDAAAARLEEVLRLLPGSAVQTLRDVRQQLAEIHVGRGDWRSARPYVELVLAQDPRNVSMLQLSTEIYERLELYRPAAEALIRLARVHGESRARARVLLRAGALLQDRLGDEGRAFELFLKASDLDPTHPPTALRLLNGYWTRGQLAEAADLADELRVGGPLPDMDPPLRLRLAMAMALARGDAAQAIERSDLSRVPWDPDLAATIFVQTAGHLAGRPPEQLQPAIAVLTSWQSTALPAGDRDGAGDENRAGNRDTAPAVSTLQDVWLALEARFLADPAEAPPGLGAALAWVALRREAPPS
jgi:tetratricopeptide (TPR) repeat protein